MCRRRAGILLAAILLAPLVAADPGMTAACMTAAAGDMGAEGDIISQEFKGSAGQPEVAYILKLPLPGCLTGKDKRDNVKETETIHLVSSKPDLLADITASVGKTVLVYGKPRGARGARDHAPVVMEVTRIQSE